MIAKHQFMVMVQGGESRVLTLADEVQTRRKELAGLRLQVQEAQALNAHLKARVPAAAAEPAAA